MLTWLINLLFGKELPNPYKRLWQRKEHYATSDGGLIIGTEFELKLVINNKEFVFLADQKFDNNDRNHHNGLVYMKAIITPEWVERNKIYFV